MATFMRKTLVRLWVEIVFTISIALRCFGGDETRGRRWFEARHIRKHHLRDESRVFPMLRDKL